MKIYDKMSVNFHLAQWMGDLVFVVGSPKKFWQQVGEPGSPFSNCPFIVKHGRDLSEESKRDTIQLARKRRASTTPRIQYGQSHWFLLQTLRLEMNKSSVLEKLCAKAISQIWQIDADRLSAQITTSVKFGNLQPNPSKVGKVFQECAAGFSGVVNRNGRFQVVAKAWMFPVLIHELTKGTAELVCLHGINKLDDQLYETVISIADKIEYEIWMIQAGAALWRKFLEIKQPAFPLAETLMHLALLEPEKLEEFLFDLIEHPLTARGTIADLFDSFEKQFGQDADSDV